MIVHRYKPPVISLPVRERALSYLFSISFCVALPRGHWLNMVSRCRHHALSLFRKLHDRHIHHFPAAVCSSVETVICYFGFTCYFVDRTHWCHLSPVTASVLARTDLAHVFSLAFCLFSSHSTVFSSASHFAPSDIFACCLPVPHRLPTVYLLSVCRLPVPRRLSTVCLLIICLFRAG